MNRVANCIRAYLPITITDVCCLKGLLFNRAILMSGSGLAPWSLVSNPAKYAAIVAHYVHCAPDLPHAHFMKCLRDKPLEQLLKVPMEQPDFGYTFGPSIDGVVIDGGDYVPLVVSQAAAKMNAATRLTNGNHQHPEEYAFRAQNWGIPGQLENKGKL